MKWQDFKFFIFLLIFTSCEELNIDPPINSVQGWEELEIHQLKKIFVSNLPKNVDTFQGSINGKQIDFGRSGKDSLIFIVPKVRSGETQLKISIGNSQKVWDVTIGEGTYPTWKKFIEEFFKLNNKILDETKDVDGMGDLALRHEKWLKHFEESFSKLSDEEKQNLTGVLHYQMIGYFFDHLDPSFNILCDFGPDLSLSRLSQRLRNLDYTKLREYDKLPSNDFHHAILSGLSLGFWFQNSVMEYYAYQTQKCPKLRGFEFVDPDSGFPISSDKKLAFKSGEKKEFGIIWMFKGVDKKDGTSPDYELSSLSRSFADKDFLKKEFSILIDKFSAKMEIDLPSLSEIPIYSIPEENPIQKLDIPEFTAFSQIFLGDKVFLSFFHNRDRKLEMAFESFTGKNENFDINTRIKIGNKEFYFSYKAELVVTCPLIANVLLIGKEVRLEITFGKEPYQIEWSNGLSGDRHSNLTPGEYQVKIIDANGCEKSIYFLIPEFGFVNDFEGNLYETVKIGNQWWMAENLRSSKKNDGTEIPNLQGDSQWASTLQPSFTWYKNNPDYNDSYGKLYNHYAACCDICPDGWRIPTMEDWRNLADTFGFPSSRKLRTYNAWPSDSLKSTNESGMNILPSGTRGIAGNFSDSYGIAAFWTGSKDESGLPLFIIVSIPSVNIGSNITGRLNDGFSIRCIKD